MRDEEMDSMLSDVVTKILYLAPNYTFKDGVHGHESGACARTMNSAQVKAEMLKKLMKSKGAAAGGGKGG